MNERNPLNALVTILMVVLVVWLILEIVGRI